MQSGFNTNIRHRGVLFHVQTEDSGRSNPHVITHLFHGGNIMASEKRDYSDQLDAQDLTAAVRGLMEQQHKAMLKKLRAGEWDAQIMERMGPDAFSEDPADTAATLPPPEPEPEAPIEAPVAAPTERGEGRAFGDGVVSQKPLDEVVLEYLVENARKRKRSAR